MLVSATLVTLPNFSKASASKYKMGLQLFTIRDAMDRDPLGSLKEVASIGYEDLETYGYEADQGKYYGFKASEFKQILADLQLTTSSGHYSLFQYLDKPSAEMERYVDQCIEGAHAFLLFFLAIRNRCTTDLPSKHQCE